MNVESYPWSEWVKDPNNAKLAKENYSEAMRLYELERSRRLARSQYYDNEVIIKNNQGNG